MAKHRSKIEGMKFGRWTVQEFAFTSGKNSYWKCLCDCGNIGNVQGSNLKTGSSVSCGCYQQEVIGSWKITHGMALSPTYESYWAMRQRCLNPNHISFPRYGGRGIKINERWLEGFENFLEDMGERPSLDYSIDRYPDKNGNYEKSNCRWATRSEQQKNRNFPEIETPWGRMTLREAAIKANLHIDALEWRKRNWPQDRWFDPPGTRLKRRT